MTEINENILTLLSTKDDNFVTVGRVIRKVIQDMTSDDSWRTLDDEDSCVGLAKALSTGRVELSFDADTVRFVTIKCLDEARVLYKFTEVTK